MENKDKTNIPKNKSKKLIAVCAIAVIAAAAAVLPFGTGCSNGDPSDTPTADKTVEAVTEETAETHKAEETAETVSTAAEEDANTFAVDLGFIALKYPKCWKDSVTVKGAKAHQACDSFTVSFAKGKNKLFDLYFNSTKGDTLGTIKNGDAQTVLSVKTYPIQSKDKDLPLMLEDMNVILENLKKDYDFGEGEVPAFIDSDVFEIKTDVVSLYYPKKWEDKVQVKVKDNTVKFMQKKDEVFDICFGQDKGVPLGYYGDTSVSVVEYDAETDEQKEMKEDINVIISHLREDSKFTE